MISFRVKKGLGHAQIGLLKEFNSKFPTSTPTPFICRVPPPWNKALYMCMSSSFSTTLRGVAWLVAQVVEQPRRHT